MARALGLYFAVHTLFATTHARSFGPLQPDLPDPATVRPVVVVIAAAIVTALM